MKRGELYRVYKGSRNDPKDSRVFVVVGRQLVIDSKFSTVTCAPVYSLNNDLSTQVQVGIEEGLKHESSVHCDELISIPKSMLTDFIGKLAEEKIGQLNTALRIALEIESY